VAALWSRFVSKMETDRDKSLALHGGGAGVEREF